MFHTNPTRCLPILAGTLTLASLALATADDGFSPKWMESGVRKMFSGYRPMALRFTAAVPTEMKKAPAGFDSPTYASFKIGPPNAQSEIFLALDAKDKVPTKLVVDSNSNGDLTDDPVLTWEAKHYQKPDGSDAVTYQTTATITIPFASGPKKGSIGLYAMNAKMEDKDLGLQVAYFCDYGVEGDVKIGDRTVHAYLEDSGCTGNFHISSDPWQNPLLSLDIEKPGRPGSKTTAPVQMPFEVDGKWWKVADMTPDGAFRVVATEKPAAPAKQAGPDLSPGKTAPSFTGKTLDGKEVKFPDDYKGKIVLIDFWATWCGPCVAEIPNVVAAYGKYHDKGLEVLGISLDKEDAAAKVTEFTKKKDMPWPQVYDGKFWSAATAMLYGIHSIPHMILIDGDTGTILADKDIRGPALAPAIEKALAGKKK